MTKNNKADLTGQAFKLEEKLLSEGYDFVIGIDEAGRGPLAGPVAACACAHKRNLKFVNSNSDKKNPNYKLQITNYDKIKDSKALSPNQREELYNFILDNFYVGVGICDHKTIDRINILEATYLAAKKSLSDLFNKINQDTRYNNQKNPKLQNPNYKQISNSKIQNKKVIILFDGNRVIPNLSMEQRAIVNGDKIVKSISAASIIAKVTRDRIMLEMHEKYPEYGFDRHKGYGTKLHMEALQKHGPCEMHRKSFGPVKASILQ